MINYSRYSYVLHSLINTRCTYSSKLLLLSSYYYYYLMSITPHLVKTGHYYLMNITPALVKTGQPSIYYTTLII